MKARLMEVPDDPAGALDAAHQFAKPAPKRPWRCDSCGIRFAYTPTLRKHQLAVHGPAPRQPFSHTGVLVCRSCGTHYTTQLDLELHIAARHPRRYLADH